MPYGYSGGGGGDGAQVGDCKWAAYESAPTGWLACDGAAVSKVTYPALFAAIGTTFGGNGNPNFNLPDLKDRVAVGVSATRARGCGGGEETHQLSEGELPVHVHGAGGLALKYLQVDVSGAGDTISVSTDCVAAGGDCSVVKEAYIYSSSPSAAVNNGTVEGNTGCVGGDAAHNNMQPFVVLRCFIKAA